MAKSALSEGVAAEFGRRRGGRMQDIPVPCRDDDSWEYDADKRGKSCVGLD